VDYSLSCTYYGGSLIKPKYSHEQTLSLWQWRGN